MKRVAMAVAVVVLAVNCAWAQEYANGDRQKLQGEWELVSLTIGGSLIGGAGSESAFVFADDIGAVTIAGNLVGGSASGTTNLEDSGSIFAARIASINLLLSYTLS